LLPLKQCFASFCTVLIHEKKQCAFLVPKIDMGMCILNVGDGDAAHFFCAGEAIDAT